MAVVMPPLPPLCSGKPLANALLITNISIPNKALWETLLRVLPTLPLTEIDVHPEQASLEMVSWHNVDYCEVFIGLYPDPTDSDFSVLEYHRQSRDGAELSLQRYQELCEKLREFCFCQPTLVHEHKAADAADNNQQPDLEMLVSMSSSEFMDVRTSGIRALMSYILAQPNLLNQGTIPWHKILPLLLESEEPHQLTAAAIVLTMDPELVPLNILPRPRLSRVNELMLQHPMRMLNKLDWQ